MKTTAAATDSPAEPVVCTMLCSRIARFPPRGFSAQIASTAIGTEAETVRPTRSARYVDAAPKTTPMSAPSRSARGVSSGGDSSGET